MRVDGRERLDSWKEIADYLHREVRTAIRWEKKGLPVHRVPGGKRHAVFAYPDELDAWIRGQENPGDAAAQNSSQATPAVHAPLIVSPPLRKSFNSYRFWYILGSSLIVLFAVFAFALYQRTRPGPPERVTFSGHSIQAWAGEGRLSWEYQLTYMLAYATVRFGDRDGDGRNDLVVVVPAPVGQDTDKSNEVFCFDGQGRVLWRYAPNLTFSSGSRRFDPPWICGSVTLAPRSKPKYVWVAFNQALWWPGCLVRLDLEGRASVRLTNAGWITTLNSFENGAGSWVLASGINNEHDQAMLAVIKEDAPESYSPHLEGSSYVLDNHPPQVPHRYFLFPRSELNRATGFPVNNAGLIIVRTDEVEVRTNEADNSQGIYLLSSAFDLEAITRTDTYWDLHRRLEKEGLIKHRVEECPERTAPAIQGWDAEKGWTVIRPNSFPASK